MSEHFRPNKAHIPKKPKNHYELFWLIFKCLGENMGSRVLCFCIFWPGDLIFDPTWRFHKFSRGLDGKHCLWSVHNTYIRILWTIFWFHSTHEPRNWRDNMSDKLSRPSIQKCGMQSVHMFFSMISPCELFLTQYGPWAYCFQIYDSNGPTVYGLIRPIEL